MATLIDKARQQVVAGKFKAAIQTLAASRTYTDSEAQKGNLGPIRAYREVAVSALDQTDASCRESFATAIGHADRILNWAREKGLDLHESALASLRGCYVIGAAGVPLEASSDDAWDLVFMDDRVLLFPHQGSTVAEAVEIGWPSLSVDIAGAGVVRNGGGFIGGGFGLVGAAAGMLTASALNAVTTRTGMDTVIHLSTPTCELYLHYGQETPAALRHSLSPVFLRLRQDASAGAPATSASGDHAVDRLHKLADLLDRGLIDESEFARLKADLMNGIS